MSDIIGLWYVLKDHHDRYEHLRNMQLFYSEAMSKMKNGYNIGTLPQKKKSHD